MFGHAIRKGRLGVVCLLLVLGKEYGNILHRDYLGIIFPYSPRRTSKFGAGRGDVDELGQGTDEPVQDMSHSWVLVHALRTSAAVSCMKKAH